MSNIQFFSTFIPSLHDGVIHNITVCDGHIMIYFNQAGRVFEIPLHPKSPLHDECMKEIESHEDLLKNDTLKFRLRAYATNYQQRLASRAYPVNQNVGLDWASSKLKDNKRSLVEVKKGLTIFGNELDREPTASGLRILPYQLAKTHGLIQTDCTYEHYQIKVDNIITTLKQLCPQVKVNARGYVSVMNQNEFASDSFSTGLLEALCYKSTRTTALIPTGLLTVEQEMLQDNFGLISPSYQNNIIRFGSLNEQQVTINRLVQDQEKGTIKVTRLSDNSELSLAHEMIHALRDRYGLAQTTVMDERKISLPKYGENSIQFRDNIDRLINIVIQSYGIGTGVNAWFGNQHALIQFRYNQAHHKFDIELDHLGFSRANRVSNQKDNIINALLDLRNQIDTKDLNFLRYSLKEFVTLLCDSATGEIRGADFDRCSDIRRAAGQKFDQQLYEFCEAYHYDEIVPPAAVIKILPEKRVRVAREEVETIGSHQEGNFKPNPLCPYTESLLRLERGEGEVFAYSPLITQVN